MGTTAARAPVSAIITTYNDAQFLADALASVAAQSVRPAQVLVIDDGSAEAAAAQARAAVAEVSARTGLDAEYVRIEHAGLSAARNAGLARAEHEFVAYLDADDYWLPEHLAHKLARLAARHERYSSAYDGYFNVDEKGRSIWTMPSGDHNGAPAGALLGGRGGIPVGAPFHLYRRSALVDVGGFDESLTMGEDFDLLLRLGRAGYFVCGSGRPTAGRRLRHGSMTTGDPQRTIVEMGRFLDKAEREQLLEPQVAASMRKQLRMWMARRLLDAGDARRAAAVLGDAFALERPRGVGQWLVYACSRRGVPSIALRAVHRLHRWRRRRTGASSAQLG